MIEAVFDLCVRLLVLLAGWLGVSYEAVNVWLFVVLWPLFTLALIAVVLRQRARLKRLQSASEGEARRS